MINTDSGRNILGPLVTSSIPDSELIIHFQEAILFPNYYNKQGIQSNLPSYTPMNQGPICAKVYPEGIQPIKGYNCGLIPIMAGVLLLVDNAYYACFTCRRYYRLTQLRMKPIRYMKGCRIENVSKRT